MTSATITGSVPAIRARTERRARTTHLENWDRLRVIAALDTVALHLAGDHAIFGFGLPLFLMLSVALGVSKAEPRPTTRFLSRRIDRILKPWMFWALLLTVSRVLFELRSGHSAFGWMEWSMLLYGPRIHLWFLPFIIGAGYVAHLAHRAVGVSRLAPWLGVLLGAVCFAVAPLVDVGWPFQQWMFSLSAIPLGFALGRAMALEPSLPRLRLVLAAGYVIFIGAAFVVSAWFEPASIYAYRYAGGLGLLIVATWLPNRKDPFTAHFTPLMLGVYILHPTIYLWVVKPVMCLVSCNQVEWLRVVLGFPATMAAVYFLRKTWLRRYL